MTSIQSVKVYPLTVKKLFLCFLSTILASWLLRILIPNNYKEEEIVLGRKHTFHNLEFMINNYVCPKWRQTRNLFICQEFQQQCCVEDSGYRLGGSPGDHRPELRGHSLWSLWFRHHCNSFLLGFVWVRLGLIMWWCLFWMVPCVFTRSLWPSSESYYWI